MTATLYKMMELQSKIPRVQIKNTLEVKTGSNKRIELERDFTWEDFRRLSLGFEGDYN
ncbi:MAG: hypothetical protein OEW78_02005 [Nitrosopumilus sp.]|uniref:hypothetical protein n=1 Tax=Nitrosopumilus sp. TaxID=2024843 RepID=UPI00247212EE|nr:hypothetical protein [Nitrosopumilus sp.]MDH5430641.1 hypothetical protein [Nitrosopumilus sp.]